MTTRKLCDRCARDTAVKGRCERLERIDRPGTICDRCLSDGRLLVSYRICCEPETRFGHTDECKRSRKVNTHPVLRRFAVALFSTDDRVIALMTNMCAELGDPSKRLATIGKAWDLAADGHEPEATYRKQAEQRAFGMQKFDRELAAYLEETKRLTRESERRAALKAVQEANARHARREAAARRAANLAKFRAEESEQNRRYEAVAKAKREAEDEQKRRDRAERKAEHPQCGAMSPIHPQGRTLSQGDLHAEAFAEERCTKQKHDYGDHQYIVNGRVISGWNANTYYVGEDQARATSRTQRSAVPSHLLRDAHLEENAQVITRDPPPAGDLIVRVRHHRLRCHVGSGLLEGDREASRHQGLRSADDLRTFVWHVAHRALVDARRAYLAENVKRGGDLRENGGRIDTTIPPMWTRGRPST